MKSECGEQRVHADGDDQSDDEKHEDLLRSSPLAAADAPDHIEDRHGQRGPNRVLDEGESDEPARKGFVRWRARIEETARRSEDREKGPERHDGEELATPQG